MSNNSQPKIPLLFSKYAIPNSWHSLIEIGLTIVFLILGLAMLHFVIQQAIWPLLIVIFPVSLLFTRIFILQHDLSHGNLFQDKKYNDIFGNLLGVLVLTPFYLWRKAHLIHHASGGNTDKRPWIGDIDFLTVREYQEQNRNAKFMYRLCHNPLVMFFIGSIYVFMIEQRIYKRSYREHKFFGKRELMSIIGTNIGIVVFYGAIIALLGIKFFLIAMLIPLWLGGAIGIYLFYVQHNFTDKYVVSGKEWTLQDSALKGSTFYDLPQPLKWLTASIGYHHVHTLVPRIPFYRLQKCHQENDFFHIAPRFGLKDLPKLVSLKLYDENSGKMISWREYKKLFPAKSECLNSDYAV